MRRWGGQESFQILATADRPETFVGDILDAPLSRPVTYWSSESGGVWISGELAAAIFESPEGSAS